MPNYNLTTQQIKDTYEQLVQVSGSAIVDGTGSLVNAFDYPSNSTYTSFSSSVAAQIEPLVAGSGSADWDLISGIPVGLVSSSTQVNLSQAFGTASLALTASFALNVTDPTWSNITGKPSGIVSSSVQTISNLSGTDIVSSSAQIATDISGAFTSTSASLAAGIATNTSNISTNTTNISTQTSRVNSLVNATSSYAVTSNNNTFTGTQTFNNIAVNGTASVAYLRTVTGSATIIGDAFIILNNSIPAQPYAGIKVFDTGSTDVSSSFYWDGITDDWKYEFHSGSGHEQSVALFGPGTLVGVTTYPISNQIQKGTGTHHLTGSNITDNGTAVTISTPLSASAVKLTSGGLTFADGTTQTTLAQGGLVAGTGTDSMKSAASLTTTAAVALGVRSIALGDNAYAQNAHDIAIGTNARTIGGISIGSGSNSGIWGVAIGLGAVNNGAGRGVAIGNRASAAGLSIAIGEDVVSSGNSSIGIYSDATGDSSIAIGVSSDVSNANEINIGGKFKYDGSNTIQLNSNGLLFNSTGTLGASSNGINLGIVGGSVTGNNVSNFGCPNGIISTNDATLVGGYQNTISAGAQNLIIGGEFNTIIGSTGYSQIFGGASHQMSGGDTSFIMGGYQNQVTAGLRNGVIGGNQAISAHDFSVVIGRQSYTTAAAYTTYVASLDVSGSTSIVNGAGATGTLVDNIHPTIASSSTQIEHIVTITQGQYTSISASAAVSDDTLYIISDAGDNVYPGNLQVNGQINSPVFAGTIASSTSSIDFDNGNFATLNCATSTFLANPTNLKSGTTYTLIVTNGANISGYGTDWKFAGAAAPTFSANTDILTAVSDGTNLYATGLADFS